MKKITALLLVICMIFMLIPIHTSAAIYAAGKCGDGVYWSLDGNGILTIYGNGAMNNDYCGVQPPWLAYRNDINTVIIKSGVTYIDDSAFEGCVNLTNVVMANSVTGLGKSVFEGCKKLSNLGLSSKLTTIGESAFCSTGIESITIPEGITTVSKDMFNGCVLMTSVTFEGAIKNIGVRGFGNCDKLVELNFEKGVSGKIGESAFADIDGWTEFEVPEGITYIDNYAFSECENLSTIILPEGLRDICTDVFTKTAITSITIPKTVTYIAKNAFLMSSKLKEITMYTETVESLPSGFDHLSLRSAHIIGDVPQTDVIIFPSCSESFVVYYDEGTSGWGPYTWQDCLVEVWGKEEFTPKIGSCGENLTWCLDGDVLTISGTGAMEKYSWRTAPWYKYRTRIRELVIEEGVESISRDAFFQMNQLEYVTISGSVKSVGFYSFYDCLKLKEVNILEGVESIDGSAFSSCDALVKVTMPDTVTSIGAYCFGECTKLTTVNLSEGLTEIPASLFYRCYSLETLTIPSQITKICSDAFQDCIRLRKLELPDTLVTIEYSAFTGSGLEEITIPAGVSVLGNYVFDDCQKLQSVRFLSDAPEIGAGVFNKITVFCFYPANNETWTEDVKKNYGGTVTWISDDHVHAYEEVVVEATCTEPGSRSQFCSSCAYTIAEETLEALGHDMAAATCTEPATCQRENCGYQEGSALGHVWEDPCLTTRVCSVCGHTDNNGGHDWHQPDSETRYCYACGVFEGGYLLDLTGIGDVAWIDGVEYPSISQKGNPCILIPHADAKTLVTYSYANTDSTDPHLEYPTGMKVWKLHVEGDYYKATYIEQFDNLLQYAGSSIRITGTKGIRMITGIDKTKKAALTGDGLAGYTLVEYGTALCWASNLQGNQPMVLGQDYVKSNYAYKKGVADPIFAQTKDAVQYTNVLVGFSLDQCSDDIAMRPYIVLKDAEGNQITIYGGIVYRSIGYIAYQNRNVFRAGTSSYKYVWEIIHKVYGTKYDADYKG